MKKFLGFLFVFLLLAFVGFNIYSLYINQSPDPDPSTLVTNIPSEEPEPTESEEPEVTPDPRNEEPVIRAEIAALIRDAKELLNAGLKDDAKMVLRDLRTRTLTPAEKKEVDALQAQMNTISD